MKRAILLAIAITFATASSNAVALGSTEAKVLQVLGGLFIVDKVVDYSHRQYHYQPAPRSNYHSYSYPAPSYQSDVDRAYMQGRLERERVEHQRAVERAYNCGYYGTC